MAAHYSECAPWPESFHKVLMITHCKVCEKEIPIPKLGVDDYWCFHCQKYFVYYDEGIATCEIVRVGNYHLSFLNTYHEASVVETNKNGDVTIMKSFPMPELTHDLALLWIEKLKTYVLFQ